MSRALRGGERIARVGLGLCLLSVGRGSDDGGGAASGTPTPDVAAPGGTTAAAPGSKGLETYPVAENARAGDGTPFTGAVVQYEGDGIVSSHHLFAQLDEVKFRYGCFFATLEHTGVAEVLAPRSLGAPCAEAE